MSRYNLQLQLEQDAKLIAQRELLFQSAVSYANSLLSVCSMCCEELEMKLMSAYNDRAIVQDVIEFIAREGSNV